MKFEYSIHWEEQKEIRKEITDDVIELCILNSQKMKDREWPDAFNAIARIPPSGRILKVVYREIYKEKEKVIKIITSYWLD
jgi:hypothetical protein